MFTRTESEVKSLRALRDLCLIQYSIQAIGNPADKASYINALLTFPVIACKQVSENKGLKTPMLSQVQALEATLEAMGTPTPEQSALLRVIDGGKEARIPSPVQSREAVWTISGEMASGYSIRDTGNALNYELNIVQKRMEYKPLKVHTPLQGKD
ncbi:hypothetical protein [Nostoc sp.]|uniref:hypothetical protein n=1 Tax=Nostoc sp. TaxID=1180 RepID=UPI002FF4605F